MLQGVSWRVALVRNRGLAGRVILLCVHTVIPAMIGSTGVGDQRVTDFFLSHRQTIIVGSDVAGGYDVYGRVLASHYVRHIPGDPSIVVQNMELASRLEATNYIANKAARDRSAILATFNSLLTQPMFDNNNVRYD